MAPDMHDATPDSHGSAMRAACTAAGHSQLLLREKVADHRVRMLLA